MLVEASMCCYCGGWSGRTIAALQLIEAGLKPVVVERGKTLRAGAKRYRCD